MSAPEHQYKPVFAAEGIKTLKTAIIVAIVSSAVSATFALGGSILISYHVQQYKLEVDSKMDALLKLTKEEGEREGMAAGIKQERNYENDQDRKDEAVDLKGARGRPGPPGPPGPIRRDDDGSFWKPFEFWK